MKPLYNQLQRLTKIPKRRPGIVVYAKPKMKSLLFIAFVQAWVGALLWYRRREPFDHMPWWFPAEDSTTLSERLINSWARHLLVAASSRRTEENVASRRGSGRHCRRASRARALSLSLRLRVSIKRWQVSRLPLTEESIEQHAWEVVRFAAQQVAKPCCWAQSQQRRNARRWHKCSSNHDHQVKSFEQ